ncbi:FGGY family carbohydrate kinase [Leekyejoonella antrihumi]|uniref:Xylulose kinase n=1 Tax=Leekyejoonella antrihumi TaxID=1660198 RepID=A0A563DSZ6_9MICO|nr:FGGY family carbohydrate kinase [Leekyejoonella antrihumi]TWP33355.1 xylulose kinase [Leekyejoonella antrihumi]
MVQRQLVAGVDSSTQSCKVVVCDARTGEIVRVGRAAHPDGTEVSARHWWDAFAEATAGRLLDGVSAIAVAGQQHGMVTLDENDGLVRDALLWNDVRSASDAADLVQELGGDQAWVDAVDVVPVASFTVSKLRWLARHEPENLARTARVVLPHDWLTGRILRTGDGFTGWTTDRGDASGTGYWSAVTGDYVPDLVRRAAGTDLAVPRVLAPAEAAGRTSDGLLVAAGTGDNMGAALGLCLQPGDVVVSLGTSGTVFAEHDSPVGDRSGEIAGFASATGGHLPLMCTLNAARVLSAGAAMIGCDLAQFDQLALEAEVGAGGLSLLPYLDGERTPNLPDSTGTLGGLTRLNATPQNLARAHVEGMLCNLAAGVDSLRRQGIRADRVLLIGGAAASRAVQEVAPVVFGVPVVVPVPGEYVARGAARQAAWALSGREEPPPWTTTLGAAHDVPAGNAGQELRHRYSTLLDRLYH